MVLVEDRLVKSMIAEPASSALGAGFKMRIELNPKSKQGP